MRKCVELSDKEILQITGGFYWCNFCFNFVSALIVPFATYILAIAAKTPNEPLYNSNNSVMTFSDGSTVMTMSRNFYQKLTLGVLLTSLSLLLQAAKSGVCDG